MVLLILGGSGSGKSAYGERRAVELARELKDIKERKTAGTQSGRLLYLATMEVWDEESRYRVARHRKMREGKGFVTVECQTHLETVEATAEDTVLLECISNLTANEMYSSQGRKKDTAEAVIAGIRRLAVRAGNLVMIGNQVFSDGIAYDASTMEYLRQMAKIQQEAAMLADEVVEVVCGIPCPVKTKKLGKDGCSHEMGQ